MIHSGFRDPSCLPSASSRASASVPTLASLASLALPRSSPPSLATLAQAAYIPHESSHSPQAVAGNIHLPRYRSFWESLQPDDYVLSIIRHGYKLPFKDGVQPGRYKEKNNKTAITNMPFCQDTVETLLVDRVVDEVFSPPLCLNPLTVASRYVNSLLKLRMCIDLSRYINLLLKKESVSLPSLDKAVRMLLPNDFQVTFDLKSAFHHVLIHPDYRQYLGFSVPCKNTGKDRYFVFRVMPFGLSTAVQLLARLTKPICILLAGEGIRISIYIDDGWILAMLRELAAQYLQRTMAVLASAGFVVSKEKSDTVADVSQVKKHLGFLVDSTSMTIAATADKLDDIAALVRQTLSSPSYPARSIAKVTGKLVALRPALGPVVFILCRLAQSELAAFTDAHSWSSKMTLSSEASSALLLLASSLHSFNTTPIRNEANATPLASFLGVSSATSDRFIYGSTSAATTIFASDASASATCAYDVQGNHGFFQQSVFSQEEAQFASGHRELLAIQTALRHPPPVFQSGISTSVFWLTDSENVVTFLSKGSPKRPIQETVLDIVRRAHALKLDIIPVHVKRSDYRIEVADFGSRFYDPDDWSCDGASFEELTRFWKVTVDLFAHYSNAQVSRFYSFGMSPHTSGVDAFAFSWDQEIAWCCPPISLVIPALRKIAASMMQAILIIPAWRSAQFWPFLFPDGLHAIDMCVSLVVFRPFIVRGPYCSNYLLQGRTAFPFLALYLRSTGLGFSNRPGSVHCPQIPYFTRS